MSGQRAGEGDDDAVIIESINPRELLTLLETKFVSVQSSVELGHWQMAIWLVDSESQDVESR